MKTNSIATSLSQPLSDAEHGEMVDYLRTQDSFHQSLDRAKGIVDLMEQSETQAVVSKATADLLGELLREVERAGGGLVELHCRARSK